MKLDHIGFCAPARDAIFEIQASMKGSGYEVPDTQAFGADIALFLKDPDGTRIEITAHS